MTKKIETKKDGKEFERFEDFVRKIVRVPKSELDKHEKEYKKEREKQAKKKA